MPVVQVLGKLMWEDYLSLLFAPMRSIGKYCLKKKKRLLSPLLLRTLEILIDGNKIKKMCEDWKNSNLLISQLFTKLQ
jgi:hypothetical protein